MGIIIKQSIKGTIWSYLGVVIGFITTAYLYPNFLTPEVVGLFGLLLSYALLFAQISSLGIHGVTSRLFPYFRNEKNRHNGYLFIASVVATVGFILFLITYYIFSPWLIASNLEKSKLFADYAYLLIPLTLFTILFTLLDVYNKMLYNTVLGTFLQEFFQRILIFVVVVLYAFGLININTLVLFFVAAVCAKAVVILFYLYSQGKLNLKPNLGFISKNLRKEMISVALYSILVGVGYGLVFNIDKIIINQMMGLKVTGVYTIAFSFGSLVLIPSRPLLRISGSLIADAWKRDDKNYISDIYKRSCINQLIIASFLFGGIWINIDNILNILGPDYAESKWVIFFIGLGSLFNMSIGANGQIIGYSKYYQVSLYFVVVLILLVVVSMIIFIPLWGIVGAAAGMAVAFAANNLMKYFFLYWKFKMQPFTIKTLLILITFLIAYIISNLLTQQQLIIDILIRSTIFTAIFGGLILGLKISDDVNKIYKQLTTTIKNYFL
jgi:O-antigen/teichoic acid export membrane protein